MRQLSGVRILIVEDEGIVAMMIEDMLSGLGAEVVASVAHFASACEAATAIDIDLAILDINLAGELVFPVAEILRERKIRFLFSSGYGASGLPPEFADRQILHKPFSQAELKQKIGLVLER